MQSSSAQGPGQSKRIYVAWKSDCFRGRQSAHVLGCELVLIHPFRSRGSLATLWRYAVSSLQTIGCLAQRRPRVLAVVNQPLPLVLIAMAYAKLFGAALVLDGHSKVYDHSAPGWQKSVYRAITRQAALTLNHNEDDAQVVTAWGGKSILFETLCYVLPVAKVTAATAEKPFILCVCSFASDEPVDVILEAARQAPEVHIKVTGDYRKAKLTPETVPPNVELLGFVSVQDYYDQFAAAAAILTLSTRNWIMQMAVGEALLLTVPVVTNRSPVLERVLGEGGVFVEIDGAEVAAGLREVLARNAEYRAKMEQARDQQRARVESRLAQTGLVDAVPRLEPAPAE